MFVVYVLDHDYDSWDYQCTLTINPDLMYSLIQLLEEVEHSEDQALLLYSLVINHRFIGSNLKIYYIENPEPIDKLLGFKNG